MTGRPWFIAFRHWGLPFVFMLAVYCYLYQRSWSVDGCLHTLASDHFMDHSDAGHVLLRPVVYLWVSIGKQVGLVTRAQEYNSLHVLFAGLGIAALTMLFGAARRRSGEGAAWACLVTISLASNSVLQIVTLDEKPLGMFLFAVAVLASERLFRRAEDSGEGPMAVPVVLSAAMAWTLAVLGHLQNAPYAAAFLVTAFLLPARKVPLGRRLVRIAIIGGCMALGAVALFTALTWGAGDGLSGTRSFVHALLVSRFVPPPPTSVISLGIETLQGWTKAFLIVDRLSPRFVLALAAAVFVALTAGVGIAFARRHDPLAATLLGASLAMMLLAPAANYWPALGDSYTIVTMSAFILLAAAPRRLLLALMIMVGMINVPAAAIRAHAGITIQDHLEAVLRIGKSHKTPWIVFDTLTQFQGEQCWLPVYYSMAEDFQYGRATLDSLPRLPFLVDLPLNVQRDGTLHPERVEAIQRELERRGCNVERAMVWDPPRILRSDWLGYGNYLLVTPAASPSPSP